MSVSEVLLEKIDTLPDKVLDELGGGYSGMFNIEDVSGEENKIVRFLSSSDGSPKSVTHSDILYLIYEVSGSHVVIKHDIYSYPKYAYIPIEDKDILIDMG